MRNCPGEYLDSARTDSEKLAEHTHNKEKELSQPQKQRQRFAPEVRRRLILKHAAEIISDEGIAALSMERIGRQAGVSKSLIYAYFPNLTELLRELLHLELKNLRLRQMEASEHAQTFEQLVRTVTHAYLEYIEEHGLLIQRLEAEPSVAQGRTGPADFARDASVNTVAEIISSNFDLPMEIAIPATDISYGLPQFAGDYLINHDVDKQFIEDLAVTMLIGSIEALQRNFTSRLKPISQR